MHIKDIIGHIFWSEYLSTMKKVTYLQYIPFCRLCKPDRALLSLLERVSTEYGTVRNLSMRRLKCWVLYSSEFGDVLLVIEDTNYCIKRTPNVPCSENLPFILRRYLLQTCMTCAKSLLLRSIPPSCISFE